jgi:hypothetical protein
MAVDPQVVVNIASEFTGKKAFKQAETATTKLEKGVKSLAKSFGLAFSVGAVVQFARVSIKAFNDQQKEIAQLKGALDSLNQGFRFTEVDQFLDKMEDVTKVGGDKLVPAFSQLARVTEDVDKAQKLLGISLDISAGTGRDLTSVTAAISRAMSGNTAALGKLNVGLDKNLLAYGELDDILDILEGKFKGSAARAVDTFEGRMKTLTIESDRAKETIGAGLVDAITILGGTNGIDTAADSMKRLSDETANALRGLALLVKQVGIETPEGGFGLANLATAIPVAGTYIAPLIDKLIKKGELEVAQRAALGGRILDPVKEIAAAKNRAKIQAALDKGNVKALAVDKKKTAEQAKQLKIKKDQLALDKAALALGKGEDIFDLDKIQVQAALLAKQDEINKLGVNATDQQKLQLANDLTRLSIKQTMSQLEDAIAAKDVEAATRLAKKLNLDLAILGALQGQEFKLKDIEKIINSFMPKKLIDIDNLDQALLLLGKMAGLKITPSTTTTTTTPITTPTTTPITTPTTTPITTPTTTPITTPITTTTTPNTITTIINDAVAAISSSEFAGTSLANPANILSSARLTAQLEQIMTGFAETNQLAADRYTAQLEEITARNTLTNNLAADRYTAMQNYYAPIRVEIVDKTSGLIEVVQNAVIENTRQGNSLTYVGNVQPI